jgi:Putative bacterial sensory transduction regulator
VLVSSLHGHDHLGAVATRIDAWLAAERTTNPIVASVDRAEPLDGERRWYVRLRGEEKDYTTVWFTLGQRTLRYETYVMPAPEENHAALYEHLLRRNERLVGAHFSIGAEDAVFLRGELPVAVIDEAELDRVLGTLYAAVEQCFGPALRIGFAGRFRS